MTWADCVTLIRADVARLQGPSVLRAAIRYPASRFLIAMRIAAWSTGDRRRLPARVVARFLYRRWSVRYGLEIPYTTTIGGGLRIMHLGGIVVNAGSTIGTGCTLFHGVTLGTRKIDGVFAYPVLGDDVNIWPGAVVLGCHVGTGARIAANAVVMADVVAGAFVGGIPAVILRP